MTKRCHRSVLAIALALVALAAASCGGGASAPLRQATAPPTARVGPPTAAPPTVEERLDATAAARCPDPYLNGAPYQPTPGAPLRLRPTGTAPPIARYQPLPLLNDAALERIVRGSIGGESARFAVVIKNMADGKGISIDAGRNFYAASLFKTWVMLEAFHQREAGLLDFGERYVIADYYGQYRLNEGELETCSEVAADDAIRAMLSVSDNVAANLMYDRVGYSTTNQALRDLGLTHSGLVQGGDLTTSAGDMALLMEAIARGQAISPGASEEMIALLESELISDRLPALLPPGTPIAHKTGNWDNATHDAGIVFSPRATYVIAVLTDYGFSDDGAGRIARLSKAVYDYYNPR